MQLATARGCPSASADRCTHSFLGHFVPTTKLDPVVKAHFIQGQLLRSLEAAETSVRAVRTAAFLAVGVQPPASSPPVDPQDDYQLDVEAQRALSELVRRSDLSLADTIRVWRGQTATDPRPNKALCPDPLEWLLVGYEQQSLVLKSIRRGIQHCFHPHGAVIPHGQDIERSNHKSAVVLANCLLHSIRDGQDLGTYMVVDKDVAARWPAIRISRFGCVPKADADPRTEARVIHDLSFPRGASVNDASNQADLPPLSYEHVAALARRIESIKVRNPHATVKIKRGDVKAAFRNLFGHVDVCAKFAGSLPRQGAVVVDLALPFGWTGSPAHYGVFGCAITFLVRRESPATLVPGRSDRERFYCYTWVDDDVLVEQDHDDRLELCEVALRLAMLAVLGPRSINEPKFTHWSTQSRALGLDWDTTTRTVSMPPDKIAKALLRIRELLQSPGVSRTSLSQVLGSLRHVCSCIRSARPFFQRIAALYRRSPRWSRRPLSAGAKLDVLWFEYILVHGQLQGAPLRYFGALSEPDVHIYMDASDSGLCALHPASQAFLRVQFDEEERALIARNAFSPSTYGSNFPQYSQSCAGDTLGSQWSRIR
uniref:Reverse transcriptase domain-containing protein n=1 Tax=Phytophthora fragariae TaxID=53985 RepID=A0A6A3EYL7_9STRA|nr:hypothetical protein PF009_g14946 [Phytophthora fragariae]